jgi:D-aminopeptidase
MSNPIDRVLADLPSRYAGAGGAVAVLREGAVLERDAWGWADLSRRVPFTDQTLFRICSITKQFTCATLLDRFPDPSVLDDDIRRLVPALEQPAPRALHLVHNQSGFRDYWAMAMLCGAPVEGRFIDADARRLVAATRTLQFAPGTRYSYCNQNFRMLGDIRSERAGRSFAELLESGIFARAGMATARLGADTASMPDGTIGYEGDPACGLRPAVNNIHWTGDAGAIASLDDMIAWERFVDASRDDADSLYGRMSAATRFADGEVAAYGFGLSRMILLGEAIVGHGGGLRGWRSFRFYAPATRTSVVVLFNHMADARDAACELFAALLGIAPPGASAMPEERWNGVFEEPETGLVARLDVASDRRVRLRYGQSPELLSLEADDVAASRTVRLAHTVEGVEMARATDHQTTRLAPLLPVAEPARDIAGVYRSDELEADFVCVASGGALSGAFSGWLGEGMLTDLVPVARDVWLLPCPRALDYAAPGDWTLRFSRDAGGAVTGVEIGCWLARRVAFRRVLGQQSK